MKNKILEAINATRPKALRAGFRYAKCKEYQEFLDRWTELVNILKGTKHD